MKVLVYQQDHFVDLQGGQVYKSHHQELDGLVIGLGQVARPLWCCPQPEGGWPEKLTDNWSVKLACCNTTEELATAMKQLDALQFEYVLKTLPLHLLEDYTGLVWPAGYDQLLFGEVLERHKERLRHQKVKLHLVEPKVGTPLNLGHAQCMNATTIETSRGHFVAVEDLQIDPQVQKALVAGLPEGAGLFVHQVQALELIHRSFQEGFDVMLTTPTASGKTFAFLPGVVEALLKDPSATALFLYPLRALVHDQFEKIRDFCQNTSPPVVVHRFMGQDQLDTDQVQLLVATPDKLNHNLTRKELRTFIRNLKVVVLDEAHVYKGVFGMNMAFLLRRLLQLCDQPPRLVVSSATLQNTVDFAHKLTGRRRFKVVGASAAPRHARYQYVAHQVVPKGSHPVRLFQKDFRELYKGIQDQHKALLFVPGRNDATQVVRSLPSHPGRTSGVALYSGIKDFEGALEHFKSAPAGVLAASTTSLEAGVDIGDLSVVGVVTFPFSRNTFKQMAGRAGRRGPAHVIYYPGNRPADQYYRQGWALKDLLEKESDPVYLNTLNTRIMKAHLRRARFECERHMLDHSSALLGAFLPDDLTAVKQERIEADVLEVFSEKVDDSPPPPLRNIPGLPHYVVRTGGEHDPNRTIVQLEISENEQDDFLLEKGTLYNAHREWAPENMVLRGERYYWVLDWERKKAKQGRFVHDAVVIWVEDVTEQLVTVDQNLLAHRNQATLTEGAKQVEHYHLGLLEVTARIEEEHDQKELGAVQARSGDGKVTAHMLDRRNLFVPRVTYLCPTTEKRHKVKVEGEVLRVQVVDRNEQFVRELGVFAGHHLKQFEKYSLHWREALREGPPSLETHLVHARTGKLQGTVQMVEHSFDGLFPGHCSCGRETERQVEWEKTPVEVPPIWKAHGVFSMTPREFDTHLCEITFSHGSIQALRAVANALLKAAPSVLEIDPGDLGYFASIGMGQLNLTLYDTLEGGAGISLEVPGRLSALLEHTRMLLKRSRECSCEGAGCYACILPFDPVEVPLQPEPLPDEFWLDREGEELDVIGATQVLPPAEGSNEPLTPLYRKLFTELLEVWEDPSTQLPHISSLLGLRGLRVQVVTDLDEVQVEERLAKVPAMLRSELLRQWVPVARKPYPQRMKHLTDEEKTDQLVLLGTRSVDVQAAHNLGVVSMLATWGSNPSAALRSGPDLVVDDPAKLSEALCNPDPFRWPLEQPRDQAILAQGVRLTAENGLSYLTLCRFLPSKPSRKLLALVSSTHTALGFKNRAMSVQTVAHWIQHHFPHHTVVTIPSRREEPHRGLERLQEALALLGHPVQVGLRWTRMTPKQTGTLHRREQNLEGAFASLLERPTQVLLVDDLLSSGATLHEAKQVLEQAGHGVEVLAVATTVQGVAGELA